MTEFEQARPPKAGVGSTRPDRDIAQVVFRRIDGQRWETEVTHVGGSRFLITGDIDDIDVLFSIERTDYSLSDYEGGMIWTRGRAVKVSCEVRYENSAWIYETRSPKRERLHGLIAFLRARLDEDERWAPMADHDPARLLADVAAKRAIIDSPVDVRVIQRLAEAYAYHPDYQSRWSVDEVPH